MHFEIRRLVTTDAAAYRQIRLEALLGHPTAFGGSYEIESTREIADFASSIARSAIFGAFKGQSLVGVIGWFQNKSLKQAHRANLFGMYVKPDCRGTGCANQLVNAVVEDAKPTSLQMHLTVAADNPAAKKLYTRLGFEIYGTDPRGHNVDGHYVDEHLMVKFLD